MTYSDIQACAWLIFCVCDTARKVFTLCLTSGPMCSVCVVRSVVWQPFIFRVALALSCKTHTHPLHEPCPESHKEQKQTKKNHQRLINQDNRMFSWKIWGACLCEHCHRWQTRFGFCPASPVTQRGHKCGLKCDKTSGAKYWTRNYNWKRNCKNVTAKNWQAFLQSASSP